MCQNYVGYSRVSTEKQGLSGLGLEAQQTAVEAFIASRGAPIASTVVTKFAADFVQEMRSLVHQAIIDRGGKLKSQVVVADPKPVGNVLTFPTRP